MQRWICFYKGLMAITGKSYQVVNESDSIADTCTVSHIWEQMRSACNQTNHFQHRSGGRQPGGFFVVGGIIFPHRFN